MHMKVAMNLFFFYDNIICKTFDTGIYRPTSLRVPSRLPTPRVGLHEVAERWSNSRFFMSLGNMRVMRVASNCELLRVTASYLSLGLSPTFVTIALLLPANYSIFR